MDTVGERLKHARKVKGLTLNAIKESAGVSIGNISDIENNKVLPSTPTLISLCRTLGISIDWLLTGERYERVPLQEKQEINNNDQTEQLTEKEVELLSIFEQIPDEQKDLAINVLKPFIKEGAATKERIEIPDRIRRKRKPVLNKKGSSYSSTGTTDRYASRMNA